MGNHSAPANLNDAATLASITVRWEDLAPHDFITSPSSAKEPIVLLGDDSLNFQPEFPVFLQAGIVSGTVLWTIHVPNTEFVIILLQSFTRASTVRLRWLMSNRNHVALSATATRKDGAKVLPVASDSTGAPE
jgi:hypothetical protein